MAGARAGATAGAGAAAYELALEVIAAARAAGITLACAESLTGGLVAAALTDVPGASVVFRGAVVSYASAVKAAVLAVPEALLAERGAVDPDVATAMAMGAARVLDAQLAVATTGVAGPDPADGKAVGRVYIAVNQVGSVRELDLPGDRNQVRAAATRAALELLRQTMSGALPLASRPGARLATPGRGADLFLGARIARPGESCPQGRC